MRVTSRLFADALLRRASGAGAFATVVRAGADAGGAIFVQVRGARNALYGPAMAGLDREEADGDDRRFTLLLEGAEAEIEARMASERRFDPDLWWIEIEDGEGRSFLDPETLRDE